MVTILFIGRFQPFHKGHEHVIRWLESSGYKVIIGIGSSDKKKTENNPWPYELRKKMISPVFSGKIVSIPDIPDDIAWVEHVETCVQERFQGVCTGNTFVAKLFEWKNYKILVPPMLEEEGGLVTGSRVRWLMKQGMPWKNLVPESTAHAVEADPFETKNNDSSS